MLIKTACLCIYFFNYLYVWYLVPRQVQSQAPSGQDAGSGAVPHTPVIIKNAQVLKPGSFLIG